MKFTDFPPDGNRRPPYRYSSLARSSYGSKYTLFSARIICRSHIFSLDPGPIEFGSLDCRRSMRDFPGPASSKLSAQGKLLPAVAKAESRIAYQLLPRHTSVFMNDRTARMAPLALPLSSRKLL